MSIPESKLNFWSHQGAIQTSVSTYNSIKSALDNIGNLSPSDYEIFLQGSYGNDTNIYSESDVDIVVKLNKTFQTNKNSLSQKELEEFNRYYPNASYLLKDFKNDVLRTLTDYYDRSKVIVNNKCIEVQTNYRKADIIVALQYRKYKSYSPSKTDNYDEGIYFTSNDNKIITNYPKIHMNKGTLKHQDTSRCYKPLVRIFKNARNKVVDLGFLSKKDTPSYFVECLLYNVPNDYFTTNLQDSFEKIKNYIYYTLDESWMCQNEIVPIFGNDITSWSFDKAQAFVRAMKDLWDNWA